MFSLTIENSTGESYVLTGKETIYQLYQIDGLDPPQAQINLTSIAGLDGARYNSAKLQTRNIVLYIKINGDVAANRRNLYNCFRTKEKCKLFYTAADIAVYIEGYVDNVTCNMFSKTEFAQISIICPDPFFKSINEFVAEVSNEIAAFTFPFSIEYDEPIPFSDYEQARSTNIYNASESSTGLQIEIDVLASISKIEIKNIINGDSLILEYTFAANDKIMIDTNTGNKAIKLIRAGVASNLFSALKIGSDFLQLAPGDNQFGYLVDDGANDDDVFIMFKYYTVYRGV